MTASGKPQLIGEYYFELCKHYPIQNILQLWGYLPVFVPSPKGKGKSKQTTQGPSYRFAVGTHVMCKMAHEWRSGTIIALDYREDHWPLGQVAPYQVALTDGSLICVPSDIDQL